MTLKTDPPTRFSHPPRIIPPLKNRGLLGIGPTQQPPTRGIGQEKPQRAASETLTRGVDMSHPRPPDDFRPEESPIAWFGEMLIAIDRGEFDRAAESKRQLDRLGWRVARKKGRPAPRPQAARPGGMVQ